MDVRTRKSHVNGVGNLQNRMILVTSLLRTEDIVHKLLWTHLTHKNVKSAFGATKIRIRARVNITKTIVGHLTVTGAILIHARGRTTSVLAHNQDTPAQTRAMKMQTTMIGSPRARARVVVQLVVILSAGGVLLLGRTTA